MTVDIYPKGHNILTLFLSFDMWWWIWTFGSSSLSRSGVLDGVQYSTSPAADTAGSAANESDDTSTGTTKGSRTQPPTHIEVCFWCWVSKVVGLYLCHHVQTVSGVHPFSCQMGTGVLIPHGSSGRGGKLATHFHLMPRSRNVWSIAYKPLWCGAWAQGQLFPVFLIKG
jgi:hypothetical protein